MYIHIVNETQREKAQLVKAVLEKAGFVVMRIVIHEEKKDGPPEIIYWCSDPADTNEAATIARTLENLKIASKVNVTDRSKNMEVPVSRQYEVWLGNL